MAQSISIKLEGLFEDEFHKQLIRACYKYRPKSVAAALKKLSLEQFVELMETAISQSGCSMSQPMSEGELEGFAGIYDQILRAAIMDVQELRSIIPKDIFITNSRVANELRHMSPNEEHTLTVGRKGSQLVEITTTINFNDKNIQFSGNASITPYDKIVHDAVCSLYSAGNDTFTPEMVYRAMNGMIESEFVSPKSIRMIVDSLEKLRITDISIDYTEQVRMTNPSDAFDAARVSGSMLMMQKVTVSTGGVTKWAYRLAASPIVYEYSKLIKQIIPIRLDLLNTKETTRSTDTVIIIRQYILQRVELMKNKKNNMNSRIISYDSIYELLNTPDDRKLRATIRSQTERLLDNYIGKEYIAGYEVVRRGRAITGVLIHLLEESDTSAADMSSDS
ncbi:MAG: hypothetical protein IKZ09_11250 [Clostridia bacterium]|nr:hypothetical protein [Clostridia bacterium]